MFMNIAPEGKYKKVGRNLASGKRYFKQTLVSYRTVEIPAAYAKDGTLIRSAGHTMQVPKYKHILHRKPSKN